MDLEHIRDFGIMIENLGNPNDIVREKHTSDLLRTIQTNPIESLLLSVAVLFSPGELAKKKAAAIIASNIAKSLAAESVTGAGIIDTLEKLLVDLFKLASEDADPVIRAKACSSYANVANCYDKVFNWVCNCKPDNRLEYFANVPALLGQRSDVFFAITEELASVGFFDEVDKQYHKKISLCLKEYLGQHQDLGNYEKVAHLLAKFAELLDEEAMHYADLTQSLFQGFQACTAQAADSKPVVSNSQEPKNVAYSYSQRADFLEAVELLSDFGPKLFKDSFARYVVQAHTCLNEQSQPIANLLRQIVLNFSYELPRRILAKPDVLNIFIHTIVSALIADDWLNPKAEDPLISPSVTDALGMVELMLDNFADIPEFLKVLSGQILQMLESEDWRVRFCGLMTLSQIGEHAASFDDLAPVIMVVLNFVRQDHALIKAACFHCIGQFCVDNKPDFQQRYSTEVFEACGLGLEDKAQRVRAYTCSCLTNLLQDATWEQVKPFAEVLIDKLIGLINHDSIFVAKTAVSAVSSFCISTNYNASKYFKKIFGSLLDNFKVKHQRSVVLCCRLVEAMSISAYYAEEADFRESIEDIKYIFKYFEGIIPSLDDQRVSYLLSAWNRLISRMKQAADESSEYLCNILIRVLGQCDEYRAQLTRKKSLLEIDSEIVPYEIDNFQIKTALRLLNSALQHINFASAKLQPAFDKLLQSCMVAISYLPDNELCNEACHCLERMLKLVMKQDFSKFALMFKSCLGIIIDRVNDPLLKNPSRKLSLCTNAARLCSLVKISIYDGDLEILSFYSAVLNAIKRGLFIIQCLDHKLTNPDAEHEQEERTELKLQQESELESLKQLLVLLGKLIKIHSSLSESFCEDLFANLFQKILADRELSAIREIEIFNFCLVFKLVQSLGNAFLTKINVAGLFQLCEKVMADETVESLELGFEAIGIIYHSLTDIHEKYFVTTVEVFQKYFDLKPSAAAPPDKIDRLKEVIICTLGKMVYNCCCLNTGIRCQPRWIDSWLEGMPLKYATKDLREQVDIILSIIAKSTDPCVRNEPVLKRMITVLLASARRLPQEDALERAKEVLLVYSHNPDNKKLLARVVPQLDDEAKIKLAYLNLT